MPKERRWAKNVIVKVNIAIVKIRLVVEGIPYIVIRVLVVCGAYTWKAHLIKENRMNEFNETNAGEVGLRVSSRNLDSVLFASREFTSEDTGHRTVEISLLMSADCGHINGAVPLVDVLKYAFLHHGDLVTRAHSELEEQARLNREAKNEAANAAEEAAEAFCEQFLAAHPNKAETERLSCDSTDAWMRVIDGYPTTGEGCTISGLPVVDYYSGREPTYIFHVLKSVRDWAEARGWRAELQDPGTVKFYPDC